MTAGFLALSGSGFLLLSGAGTAHAAPAATPAPAVCTELLAASKSYSATLTANQKKFQTDRTAYLAAVDNYGSEVTRIFSTSSSALQSAAKTYVTDLETENAAGDINQARLNTDDDRLAVLACTPKGAPRTGGGSSAGLEDPALFGAGGTAALAGLVVVGLALRGRSRTSVE